MVKARVLKATTSSAKAMEISFTKTDGAATIPTTLTPTHTITDVDLSFPGVTGVLPAAGFNGGATPGANLDFYGVDYVTAGDINYDQTLDIVFSLGFDDGIGAGAGGAGVGDNAGALLIPEASAP